MTKSYSDIIFCYTGCYKSLSRYLDTSRYVCLDNWIYLDLDVDPGEDVRSAQWALGQVVAALGAGAQVPARQQDHAALKHCIALLSFSIAELRSTTFSQ